MKKSYIDQMVDYLKANTKKGYTRESLKWALIDQGHSKLEVDRAFSKFDEEMANKAPVLKTKPEIKYEIVEPANIVHKPVEKQKPFWKKFFG